MDSNQGEQVDATTFRRQLRSMEEHVRAARVALIVTFYRRDWWVLAPPESLTALGFTEPERQPISAYHDHAARLANRVNTTGQPIVFTRDGADRWVMAPLTWLSLIRTALRPADRAEQE